MNSTAILSNIRPLHRNKVGYPGFCYVRWKEERQERVKRGKNKNKKKNTLAKVGYLGQLVGAIEICLHLSI